MKKPDDGLPDFDRIKQETVKLLAILRRGEPLCLMDVLADKHQKGALAELEGSGAIRAVGKQDQHFNQHYKVAPDEATANQWRDKAVGWPSDVGRRADTPPFMLFKDTMPHRKPVRGRA